MISIVFSHDFFKQPYEASAVSTILNSFKRYLGIFHQEFKIEIWKNPDELNGIYLSVGQQYTRIKDTNYGRNKMNGIKIAERVLKEISNLDSRLSQAVNLFLKNRLWELELLILYCKDTPQIRYSLLKKYKDILPEGSIHQEPNTCYMCCYFHYLITPLLMEYVDKSPSYIEHEYYKKGHNIEKIWHYNRDDIRFLSLACATLEHMNDVDKTKQKYLTYINILKKRNLEYEISDAYNHLAQYLKKKNQQKYQKYKQLIHHYSKLAYEYGKYCNYESQYLAIFQKSDNVYGLQNGLIQNLERLRYYIKEREKIWVSDISLYLYDCKTSYSLGRIDYSNSNYKRAINYFQDVESIFTQIIRLLWHQLGLNDYANSENELFHFVYGEMMYNLWSDIYLYQNGSDSEEYIRTINKRDILAKTRNKN